LNCKEALYLGKFLQKLPVGFQIRRFADTWNIIDQRGDASLVYRGYTLREAIERSGVLEE
jgi:hypothetical protein